MKKILALLLVVVLLFSGCSTKDKPEGTTSAGKNTDTEAGISTETGFEEGYGADDLEVVIAEDLPELMEFESRSIGNATFTVEANKRAKLKYTADGKEQSISVTDDSGIEWMLKIPGNALLNEEEISITPLSGIEVDSFPGAEFHGIILRPDGLEFITSSNVIVKKAGETIEGVILTGKHDGSEIVLAPAEQSEGGIKAPVQHFSTILFLPKNDLSFIKLQSIALEQYEEALEEAEELLKKPLSVLAPPSISLECMNEEKEQQIKEYSDTVLKEEEEVLSKFIAADKGMWSTFESVEMNDAVIKKVLDRMNAKIQKLITQYEPDPEKFIAVFYTAIRAWKQSSIFIETPELSVFQSWAEKTREHYMDKLARAHEYKAFSAALEIDRIYSVLLGMNDESLLQQIIDAMTFQVSFDGKIVQSDGGGTYTWSSEGEAKDVRWAGDLRDGSYLHLIGTGEGKHKEYSTTSDSTINSTRKKNFTFDVSVLPDPCDTGRVKVDIKKFGPDTLTYIDSETGGEVEMASQYSYMWIMLDIFNREEGGFAVVMDLADGVAEFEGTLGGTYENGKISYTIRLQHTPK